MALAEMPGSWSDAVMEVFPGSCDADLLGASASCAGRASRASLSAGPGCSTPPPPPLAACPGAPVAHKVNACRRIPAALCSDRAALDHVVPVSPLLAGNPAFVGSWLQEMELAAAERALARQLAHGGCCAPVSGTCPAPLLLSPPAVAMRHAPGAPADLAAPAFVGLGLLAYMPPGACPAADKDCDEAMSCYSSGSCVMPESF